MRPLSALSLSLTAALVLGGCNASSKSKADQDGIPIDQVPPAVQAAFDKAYPGAKIKEIERETYKDGTVHYEYSFTDAAGKAQEVELNEEGDVLDEH